MLTCLVLLYQRTLLPRGNHIHEIILAPFLPPNISKLAVSYNDLGHGNIRCFVQFLIGNGTLLSMCRPSQTHSDVALTLEIS
jgi:hypothetical protein